MTLSTTLLGVGFIPPLVQLCLGRSVGVDALAMLRSTASLVLAPLAAGLAMRQIFPRQASRVRYEKT